MHEKKNPQNKWNPLNIQEPSIKESKLVLKVSFADVVTAWHENKWKEDALSPLIFHQPLTVLLQASKHAECAVCAVCVCLSY